MLKSVEILIGLSVVMLVLSMVVTVLTQFVISVLNSRGRHLKNGLADLLKQIDPKLKKVSEGIAARILTHPVIRETSVGSLYRMGSVIQREEFTKLLLELGAGEGPHSWTGADVEKFQKVLSGVLTENGIADPKATLANARMLALNLEASNPQLANNVRHSIALLQEATSPLTAKINAWFDQMMDRTSERFTFTTRGITFVCAAIVALLLQVDSIGLVNRLGSDDQLRAELNQMADRVMDTESTNQAMRDLAKDPTFATLTPEVKRQRVKARSKDASRMSNDALNDLITRRTTQQFVNTPEFTSAPAAQQRERLKAFRPDLASRSDDELDKDLREYSRPELSESEKEYLTFLNDRGLVTLPRFGTNWTVTLAEKNFLGIVVSMFLLSLGAPFWYSALKQLVNLRSVLANKEDKQREERQTTQATPATTSAAMGADTPASLNTGGERGDLGALG
jgi:hypothetical protein